MTKIMKIEEMWSRKTIGVKVGSVYQINRFDNINYIYNLNYPKDNHINPELQFYINGIVISYVIENMDGYDHYYLTMKTDDGNIINVHNTYTDLLSDISRTIVREVKSHYLSSNDKIGVTRRCEPFMYGTSDKLGDVNIGDILEVSFKNRYSVKKEYKNKVLKFIVNNFYEYEYYGKVKRLALVPLEKKDKFKYNDILFLDSTERFENLMVDLFPCNRVPFRGWKNRTVSFKKIT